MKKKVLLNVVQGKKKQKKHVVEIKKRDKN